MNSETQILILTENSTTGSPPRDSQVPVKRPRGRPKKEKLIKPKRKVGRPKKEKEIKFKKKSGQPLLYPEGSMAHFHKRMMIDRKKYADLLEIKQKYNQLLTTAV